MDITEMNKRYSIRSKSEQVGHLLPEWCEPQVIDEDKLMRSRIVVAWEYGNISEEELLYAIKNMRPAYSSIHRTMFLTSPKVK